MQLNKADVIERFAEIAVKLGVAPARGDVAGRQMFDSMARVAEKHAKEADRDRRKCGLPVVARPAPDVALVDWLGSLPVDMRDATIANNVRAYVSLYQDELVEKQDGVMADSLPVKEIKMTYIIMRRDDCEALRWNGKLRESGYRIDGEIVEHETSSDALLYAKELRAENFVIDAEHYEEVRALYARRKPNSSLYAYTSAHEIKSVLSFRDEEGAVEPLVSSGLHCGRVLSVLDGIVTQKVSREGGTVAHAARALSLPVVAGQVVDIKYAGGIGVVSGRGIGVDVGR